RRQRRRRGGRRAGGCVWTDGPGRCTGRDSIPGGREAEGRRRALRPDGSRQRHAAGGRAPGSGADRGDVACTRRRERDPVEPAAWAARGEARHVPAHDRGRGERNVNDHSHDREARPVVKRRWIATALSWRRVVAAIGVLVLVGLVAGIATAFPVAPATIWTVAGSDRPAGLSGDGGAATEAQLNAPDDVTVDPAGNILIADTENSRVRRISPSGTITTIAGTSAGFSGDGGSATSARLNHPNAVAVDAV